MLQYTSDDEIKHGGSVVLRIKNFTETYLLRSAIVIHYHSTT